MATATEEVKTAAPKEAKQKRALVTGASSGIGEEFARQLAAKGYAVVLVARRQDRLEALATSIGGAEVLPADLLTSEGLNAVSKRLAAGDIDLVVNNAGYGTLGQFAEMPIEREMDEIDLNVKALVTLSHAAAGPMVERGSGTIINVASLGGFQPCPYMATYVATKAFVLSFSESLHEELRPRGVTVTCLCPGFVRTEFQEHSGVKLEEIRSFGIQTPKQVVAAALKGAAKGKAIVIPGAINGIMSQTGRIAPRAVTRKVAGSFFKDLATKDSTKNGE